MKTFCVLGGLAVLAGIATSTPFLHRPSGLPISVGLGTFQCGVAVIVGIVALSLLVVASERGIIWLAFLRPQRYHRGALQSLQYAALALAGEVVLFLSLVAIGFQSFYTNTSPGPVVLEEVLHGLMALVAVGAGVLVARAILLLGLPLTTSRS